MSASLYKIWTCDNCSRTKKTLAEVRKLGAISISVNAQRPHGWVGVSGQRHLCDRCNPLAGTEAVAPSQGPYR